MSFFDEDIIRNGPWQALERTVARYMVHSGFNDVRIVGGTGDGGADVIGSINSKRWIVQVKFRNGGTLPEEAASEALNALRIYDGQVPVVASNTPASDKLLKRQSSLMAAGIPLQVWDRAGLQKLVESLPEVNSSLKGPRPYQKGIIKNAVNFLEDNTVRSGIVIMATGLGKTFVAGDVVRRALEKGLIQKILFMVHSNAIVLQLERSLWPFLKKDQKTAIWNGNEKGDIEGSTVVFASCQSVSIYLEKFGELPVYFDLVIIDEAHHAGSPTYKGIINTLGAGKANGPFLIGLTATPWRSDENDVSQIFEEELGKIDLIQGMAQGYLSNVDYRVYVDNIDWKMFADVENITPGELNRTIFVTAWDDGVVDTIQKTWSEINNPRGIIFCRTIEHAFRMKKSIKSRGFCRVDVIYSGKFEGHKMNSVDRARLLSDFSDGKIDLICAVDIFNEGVDVPDVNFIAFQRVTHSRRIFVQQLGRGLRISDNKEKVVVLDFVSDIRRIAALSDMKHGLEKAPKYFDMPDPVKFYNKNGETPGVESFLCEWLQDVGSIEDAKDDDHILKFPNLDDFDIEGYNKQ